MPPKSRAPALSLAEILNKCQEMAGSHGKLARMLWDVEAAGSDACYKELITFLSHVLTVPLVSTKLLARSSSKHLTVSAGLGPISDLKRVHLLVQNTNSNAERLLRFVATFTAEAPRRSDDSASIFVQDLVADLVLLSTAANRVVRVRACSLLASIMQRLTVDLQSDALEELQTAMLARLKDKVSMPPSTHQQCLQASN